MVVLSLFHHGKQVGIPAIAPLDGLTSPDIFVTFMVKHDGAKERRNMVRVIDEKTGAESWGPLFDETGAAPHPEL